MEEVCIKIPEELRELMSASRISWQIAVERKLKEEFEEFVKLKKIVAKSKLTDEQAEKLADEVNLSLAKKYEKLAKE